MIRPGDMQRGKLRLVDLRDGSVTIHQDVDLYATVLAHGETVGHRIAERRGAGGQIASGAVLLNSQLSKAGDGAAVVGGELALEGAADAEALLFDLALNISLQR